MSSVPSPCVNICRMHPATGWCEGCHRTIDEIAAWSRLDDAAKQAVWQQLDERAQQAFDQGESLKQPCATQR